MTQAIVAGKKYKSFKDLRGATVGVQSLASGATTTLKRIFKKNGLEYPADYKLLAVGGGNFNLAALAVRAGCRGVFGRAAGLRCREQGMNVLAYYKDYIPNYQLTVISVKRGWAERNRALPCVSSRARCVPITGCSRTKKRQRNFSPRKSRLSPELARKGWEYYTANRIWHPNLELNTEGIKVALEILAEESKSRRPIRSSISTAVICSRRSRNWPNDKSAPNHCAIPSG